MIQLLISLVGPTASGKSAFGLRVAHAYIEGWTSKARGQHKSSPRRVAIVSADSRQVYQGLEIISGADIPSDFSEQSAPFSRYTFYRHSALPIFLFGTSLISPLSEWSVAHFRRLVQEISTEFANSDDLILLVGGTMLYQQAIDMPELDLSQGPDVKVREMACEMNVSELQHWLTSIDESALSNLNDSDRNNPRRLVRAIERSGLVQKKDDRSSTSTEFAGDESSRKITFPMFDHRWYGLTTDIETLQERICQRVISRIELGAQAEAENLRRLLLESGVKASSNPAWSSCGVAHLLAYADGEITREQCIELWTAQELRYVKRQWTWWKKQPEIIWSNNPSELADKMRTEISVIVQ